MAEAKAGDVCRRCGQRVKLTYTPTGDLTSSFEPTEPHLTCDCMTGPLVGQAGGER